MEVVVVIVLFTFVFTVLFVIVIVVLLFFIGGRVVGRRGHLVQDVLDLPLVLLLTMLHQLPQNVIQPHGQRTLLQHRVG